MLEMNMHKRFLVGITIFAIHALFSINALAAPKKFTGINYSGVYACKGSNVKIGSYELVVTFTMNKANSRGKIGSYDLNIETENATQYNGRAIANGKDLAMTIAIVDGDTLTYSTGIAIMQPVNSKRFSYVNQYYESKQTTLTSDNTDAGNYGFERCMMLKPKVKQN